MNRPELADFLRRHRARLAPSDVGLPAGRRRRTPGLRREETAALAGMSADYYTRLEQARGPRPSKQTLAALARALRLTDDERDHLFHLAGEEPPRVSLGADPVRPGLQLVLDRLHDTPAQVLSDWGEVLAQNAMSRALTGDFASRPPRRRNLVRAFSWSPGRATSSRRRTSPPTRGPRPPPCGRSSRPIPATRGRPPSRPNCGPGARSSPACGRTTGWRSCAPRSSGSGIRWWVCWSWTARCC